MPRAPPLHATQRCVRGPHGCRARRGACAVSGAGAARCGAVGCVLVSVGRVCVSSGDFIRGLCGPYGARTPPPPSTASSACRSRCSTVLGGTTTSPCSTGSLALSLHGPSGALVTQRRAALQSLADRYARRLCCAPMRTPHLAALCSGGTCRRDEMRLLLSAAAGWRWPYGLIFARASARERVLVESQRTRERAPRGCAALARPPAARARHGSR